MPELPEVETVARGVHARIQGEQITSAWFSEKPEPFKTPPAEMGEALTGCTIDCVRRVGKHIVFDLSAIAPGASRDALPRGDVRRNDVQQCGVQWIVHLGMTGRLLVSEATVPVPAHTHAVLGLSSGRELRFVDARRFGRLALHRLGPLPEDQRERGPGSEPRRRRRREVLVALREASAAIGAASDGDERPGGFAGTGAEPLTISQADFRALFHGRKTSIKAALLNQKLLHGVGNIYADESLFRAGIRPRRQAARLTRAELDRLHASLRDVLQAAIVLGGSSVSDYVDADGVRGFFQLEHRVYMRTGEPCLVCGTPIRRIVVAGRGTHYCSICQR